MNTPKTNTKKESFERENHIIDLAKEQYHREGECEIEDSAIVSEGSDNGAYVQAWVWVDFADTELDKEMDLRAVAKP